MTSKSRRKLSIAQPHEPPPMRRRGKTLDSSPSAPANLARHAAKCRVCNHPHRLAIEFDFLNWRNPFDLAKSYRLGDLSTIYRHAHATGLFARRRLNLRFALERIVERVGEVPVTAGAVIRAARAITRINDAGEWIDPPAHLVISRSDSPAPSGARLEVEPRSVPIFDPALLEEPSLSPASEQPVGCREARPISPTSVVLALDPQLAAALEARRRILNDSRQRAASPMPRDSENPGDSSPRAQPASDRGGPRQNSEETLIANEPHSPEKSND